METKAVMKMHLPGKLWLILTFTRVPWIYLFFWSVDGKGTMWKCQSEDVMSNLLKCKWTEYYRMPGTSALGSLFISVLSTFSLTEVFFFCFFLLLETIDRRPCWLIGSNVIVNAIHSWCFYSFTPGVGDGTCQCCMNKSEYRVEFNRTSSQYIYSLSASPAVLLLDAALSKWAIRVEAGSFSTDFLLPFETYSFFWKKAIFVYFVTAD